jgi:hypothetical protein
MVRRRATDGQMGSQSHQERSFCGRANSSLPGSNNLMSSRPLDRQACSPSIGRWPGLLEEFDVQFLMLDKHHDAELLGLLQAHPSWAIDSQDDQSVLLVRTDVGPSAA